MDLHDSPVLHLGPLAHQLEPPGIQLQVLRTFWLLQVLSEVLVADCELFQRVLQPKENSGPRLGQQSIRLFGVLADLEIELRTYF